MSTIHVTDNDFDFRHEAGIDPLYTFHAETGIISWVNSMGEAKQDGDYPTKYIRKLVGAGTWIIQTPPEPEIIDEDDETTSYIVSNQIRCNKCDDTPFSAHRHDFKYCKCGAVAVDGGQDYLRRIGHPDNYTEMSITIDRKALFTIVNDVEMAVTTNRNSFGITLAALRGLRDSGLVANVTAHGLTRWETPMTVDERIERIDQLIAEKMGNNRG